MRGSILVQLTWCATILAISITRIHAVEARRPVLKPDFRLYHTAEDAWNDVIDTVKTSSSFMQMSVNHTTVEGGYNSTLAVVTVEPGGRTKRHEDKLRILVNFGQHGRELVSTEIALTLLHTLGDGVEALAPLLARHSPTTSLEAVQPLIKRTVWKIMPMENIWGRDLVEAGQFCERRNGRGVDTNRNWGVDWGKKEADYDPHEENPGTAAFSEPEAMLVREVATAFRPHIWVNVHSGMEALFMPYDHRRGVPEGASAAASNATLRMLDAVNGGVFGGRCKVGSGGKSVGYLAHGTATDYMHEVLKVPIALTWEVYGDMDAAYEDCYRAFNPVTRKSLNATVSSWTAAFFAMLALVPEHAAMPPAFWSQALTTKLLMLPDPKSTPSTAALLGRRGGDPEEPTTMATSSVAVAANGSGTGDAGWTAVAVAKDAAAAVAQLPSRAGVGEWGLVTWALTTTTGVALFLLMLRRAHKGRRTVPH